VAKGLDDPREGRETREALLVAIGRPRQFMRELARSSRELTSDYFTGGATAVLAHPLPVPA
jgi:hypothetical protein